MLDYSFKVAKCSVSVCIILLINVRAAFHNLNVKVHRSKQGDFSCLCHSISQKLWCVFVARRHEKMKTAVMGGRRRA